MTVPLPPATKISKSDLAALSSTTGDVLTSEDGTPIYKAKATAAQASFDGLDLVCIGDSQVRGSTLDDLTTQPWPALVGQALPGSTVTNLGIHGANSAACLADAQNRIDDPEDRSFVVMWGRNDINQGLSLDTPKANTQAAVTWFGSDRYILVTVPYEDDVAASESSTTAAVDEFNTWLKTNYPNNVLDLNTIYAANADPANTGDAADVAAFITPRSLRNDYVHANAAAHAIQAEAVLKMLAVIAPESKPVLEPKSQADSLGATSARAPVHRANVWQRLQTFVGGILLKTYASAIGDGTGFAVGGIVGGIANRWAALAKFQGGQGTLVKASGTTFNFSRSSSSSDVMTGTRTVDASWTDSLVTVFCQVYFSGNATGVTFDSSSFKRYGILNKTGSVSQHIRASGATIKFSHSDSTTDVTTGTITDDLLWADNLFTFKSLIYCTGSGTGIVFDSSSFKRYAVTALAGGNPQHRRSSGATINFVSSDSTTDCTTGTLTVDMAWSNDGWKILRPIGLNGSNPVAKGTITGSRSDGTAFANLLTYLASRGDITDSSTA